MIGLVIVAHGGLAVEFRNALEHIVDRRLGRWEHRANHLRMLDSSTYKNTKGTEQTRRTATHLLLHLFG